MFMRFLLSMVLVSGSFLTFAAAAYVPPQSDQDKLFDQAVQDYNSNRFPKAQEKFEQIQGAHAQEAKQYLDNIKAYMDAMTTADDIMRRSMDELDLKSVESAVQEYNKAIGIKSDGPGGLTRKLTNASKFKDHIEKSANQKAKDLCDKFVAARDQREQAAGFVCQLADSDPTYLCGGDAAGKLCKQYTISAIAEPTPPPTSKAKPTAIPEPTGRHSEMLREAKAAYESNDFQGARVVLESISSDPLAKDYLDQISRFQSYMAQAKLFSKASKYDQAGAAFEGAANIKPNGPGNPGAGVLQMKLFEGLDQFYSGDYPAAIQHLEDYTQGQGEKQALAHFYLGASKLARYLLGGQEDAKLQQDAMNDLKEAKQAGFSADTQEVSPAILQAYRNLPAKGAAPSQ